MEKILGLDLGTNSIGWAIRDTSVREGNQIIAKGVLTFEKGVAMNKDNEEPKVKKRTESRGKRRNYQSEKYRKWELLRFLSNPENGMCPISEEELRKWSVGEWQEIDGKLKNSGRKYPKSEAFINWLRFDFDGDGKPDFERFGFSKHENCYLFRMLAASEEPAHRKLFKDNPLLLGRVLYQMVQRRGFKGRDEEEAETMLEGSEKAATPGRNAIQAEISKHKTLGAALYHLSKEGKRVRKRYNLRSDFEVELKEICRVQGLSVKDYERLCKAIIWQRDLRTQKGLVGLCTFEKNKARAPLSHPLYEEFRTWVFIHNLKIEPPKGKGYQQFLAEHIYPIFYKKADDFKLSEIAKVLDKTGGRITANFKYGEKDEKGKQKKDAPDTKVVNAALMYQFQKFMGDDWKEKYGWDDALQNRYKIVPYSFEDIWHILHTFNSREKLESFAKEHLGLDDKKQAESFSKIKTEQGYATLSLAAIKKMLPYLHRGFIYPQAVYLANMHKVLGLPQLSEDIITHFSEAFQKIEVELRKEKDVRHIVNGLVSSHLAIDSRYAIENGRELDDAEKHEVLEAVTDYYGQETWSEKTEAEQTDLLEAAERYFLYFLQQPIRSPKDKLYFKIPRLHDAVFTWLVDTYPVPDDDKHRRLLWHPSEQETYPEAKEYRKYNLDGVVKYIPMDGAELFEAKNPDAVSEGVVIRQLGAPQPISRGFKNPMALKTLHKLKHLINYLIQRGKIDEETRVVVEIARELNDANRRKAIETWQRFREKENEEFAKAIIGTAKVKYPDLDEKSPDVISKFRLWFDQLENGQEVLKQVRALKTDVERLRLWRDQRGQCLYTGDMISITELFNGAAYDFEHTIPVSDSFDSELKNLTIANKKYNQQIKGKRLPAQCPNYYETKTIDGKEYTAIAPRLEWMEQKVKRLESILGSLKKIKAATKEKKDELVQKRHLYRFEYDYWRAKYERFTYKEFKAGWRNSQLRDTQIITKYALPYLKTVFKKTEVQKGSTTDTFRKIYGISPRLEKKDRTKHSHHAIDAAVLTLIPTAATRDQLMREYGEAVDAGVANRFHPAVKDWPAFQAHDVLSIEYDVLINFQPDHRTLTPTRKKVRKRGEIQYVRYKDSDGKWQFRKDAAGEKIPMYAQGDTIRGALHEESFMGLIKQPIYDEKDGKFIPRTDGEGNFIFQQKDDTDELFVVKKIPLTDLTGIDKFKKIVDPNLRSYLTQAIEKRIAEGKSFEQAIQEPVWAFGRKKDKNGKVLRPLRHVRCRVAKAAGFLSKEKTVAVHSHTFPSKQLHKREALAGNDEMVYCLLYENENGRSFRLVSRFELSALKVKNPQDFFYNNGFNVEVKGAKKLELPLSLVLQPGTKVILLDEQINTIEALRKLAKGNFQQLLSRLFVINNFNNPSGDTMYIYLVNHLDARKSTEQKKDETKTFDPAKYNAALAWTADKFTCAIEGRDFEVHADGSINWLHNHD